MDLEQSRNAYDNYLSTHIANVKKAYEWLVENNILTPFTPEVIDEARQNVINHDRSKYEELEYEAYRQYFDPLDDEIVENGKGSREKFNVGWNHHKHNNPHHWEYFCILDETIPGKVLALDMEDKYIIEMISDWMSFSFKVGNIAEVFNWYDSHKDGIILSDSTKAKVELILANIAKFIGAQFKPSTEETHELNPALWNGTEIKPEVGEKLNEIVDQFLKGLNEKGIPVKVVDIYLVGSNASYNYTDKSDLDVHVVVDPTISENPDILNVLYDYYKSTFNKNYDISIHGVPIELYLEDFHASAVTNGIYSLLQHKWIKEPVYVKSMNKDISNEEKSWIDRYNSVIATGTTMEIQSLLNDLYRLRKESLATDGEYGVGNLIFKDFRNKGYLDELKQKLKDSISKELSMENLKENLISKESLNESYLSNTVLPDAEAYSDFDAFKKDLEDKIANDKKYLDFLNNQAPREINAGGNFESQEDIDETKVDVEKELNELELELSEVNKLIEQGFKTPQEIYDVLNKKTETYYAVAEIDGEERRFSFNTRDAARDFLGYIDNAPEFKGKEIGSRWTEAYEVKDDEEILLFDPDDAKEWEGKFVIDDEQGCANSFGKPVKNVKTGEIFYPTNKKTESESQDETYTVELYTDKYKDPERLTGFTTYKKAMDVAKSKVNDGYEEIYVNQRGINGPSTRNYWSSKHGWWRESVEEDYQITIKELEWTHPSISDAEEDGVDFDDMSEEEIREELNDVHISNADYGKKYNIHRTPAHNDKGYEGYTLVITTENSEEEIYGDTVEELKEKAQKDYRKWQLELELQESMKNESIMKDGKLDKNYMKGYVDLARKDGRTDDDIRASLKKVNMSDEDINDLLATEKNESVDPKMTRQEMIDKIFEIYNQCMDYDKLDEFDKIIDMDTDFEQLADDEIEHLLNCLMEKGMDKQEYYEESVKTEDASKGLPQLDIDFDKLKSELKDGVLKFYGGDKDLADYNIIEVEDMDDKIKIEVRDELDYEDMDALLDILNPIVQKYNTKAYFEPVEAGIADAYIWKPRTGSVEDEVKKWAKDDYESHNAINPMLPSAYELFKEILVGENPDLKDASDEEIRKYYQLYMTTVHNLKHGVTESVDNEKVSYKELVDNAQKMMNTDEGKELKEQLLKENKKQFKENYKKVTEGVTLDQFKQITDIANEIGIKTAGELQDFINKESKEQGIDDVLELLKNYREKLGPDFKIKEENKKVENSNGTQPSSVSEEFKDYSGKKITWDKRALNGKILSTNDPLTNKTPVEETSTGKVYQVSTKLLQKAIESGEAKLYEDVAESDEFDDKGSQVPTKSKELDDADDEFDDPNFKLPDDAPTVKKISEDEFEDEGKFLNEGLNADLDDPEVIYDKSLGDKANKQLAKDSKINVDSPEDEKENKKKTPAQDSLGSDVMGDLMKQFNEANAMQGTYNGGSDAEVDPKLKRPANVSDDDEFNDTGAFKVEC